jgi:hypothetical protein
MEKNPTFLEKLLSGLTYPTMGMVGFLWLIVCAVRRSYPSRFGLYHILQSVFLSLCYVIINYIFWWLVNFLSYIPFLNKLLRHVVLDIFNSPILFGYSIMQCLIYGTIIYLAVFAFMGLYSYIPWFSDVIKSNLR